MSRRLAVSAVAALLVVDLVLLAWLARWIGDQRHTGDADPGSSAAPTTPAAEPTGPDPSATAPTGAVSVTMSGSIIMRVTLGSCTGTGRPMLEQSTNLGQSFSEIAVPVLTAEDGTTSVATTVLSATATSPDEIQIIAGDADCTPRGYVTDDGGLNWVEADVTGWYVGASGDSVTSPTGAHPAGCTVRSLSVFSEINAKVLCEGGIIRGTNDAGETWVVLGELADATALQMIGLFDGIGIGRTEECASQVRRTGSAGNAWETVGCVEPATQIDHLVGTAGRLVAIGPESAWVSTDQGATWVPAGTPAPE